jgi:protein phosphatase
VPTVATIAGITDVGSKRNRNEDTFRVSELGGPLSRGPAEVVARIEARAGIVLGVYDGSGGFASDDLASETAARVVAESLAGGPVPAGPSAIAARLATAVTTASDTLVVEQGKDPTRRGGGTTATVALLADEHLVVAHVGDSRAYRLRGRELVQLTQDDTLLQEALRTGHVAPGDAASFPYKNVLLQVLGSGAALKVAVSPLDARHDDVILLCTDGIHGMIGDHALRAVLLRHRAPGVACRVLVEEALRAGGDDNIAVVVARLDGGTHPVADGDGDRPTLPEAGMR